jgi:hypothetical protein
MRDTPCAARGAEPLAFCSCRWGVAGRVDLPAEVGGGGPKGRRQGGFPPISTIYTGSVNSDSSCSELVSNVSNPQAAKCP